jgi:DNA-directed RNA polymerase specialized sigma24 family protein
VVPEPEELASLPWPRLADDGVTQLGIDLKVKHLDVLKLVRKRCRFEGLDADDLLQEVYAAILRKNLTASAWDSRRAGFGKYVVMVGRNTALHMLEKKCWQSEATSEEALDVADEHDPIAAFEIAREYGLTVAQIEAQIERQAERAAEAAAAPKAVQLGMFDLADVGPAKAAAGPNVATASKPSKSRPPPSRHQAAS